MWISFVPSSHFLRSWSCCSAQHPAGLCSAGHPRLLPGAGSWHNAPWPQCTWEGKSATRDHLNSHFHMAHHQPRVINTTEEKISTDRHKGHFPFFQLPHRKCRITSAGHQALLLHQPHYSILLYKLLLNRTAVISDNFRIIKIKLPIQCLCYKRSQNYIYSSFYFHYCRCPCLEDRVIQRPFLCYRFIICILCRLLIQRGVRCAKQVKYTFMVRLCKNKYKTVLVSF